MTCEFADRDGTYVLGALPPAERLAFEEHLAGCADCARGVADLAGLPGLLARIDPTVLDQPPVEEPVPDTLLPALLREVRRTRRRRGLVTAGLVAATAAVAVPVLVVPRLPGVTGDAGDPAPTRRGSPGPAVAAAPGTAMVPVGDAHVRASLALAPVAWGTRLDLTCTYSSTGDGYHSPQAVVYGLFVRTRAGITEQVGTWRPLEDRTMRLTAATAATRPDIASVEVRTAAGRSVLRLVA